MIVALEIQNAPNSGGNILHAEIEYGRFLEENQWLTLGAVEDMTNKLMLCGEVAISDDVKLKRCSYPHHDT